MMLQGGFGDFISLFERISEGSEAVESGSQNRVRKQCARGRNRGTKFKSPGQNVARPLFLAIASPRHSRLHSRLHPPTNEETSTPDASVCRCSLPPTILVEIKKKYWTQDVQNRTGGFGTAVLLAVCPLARAPVGKRCFQGGFGDFYDLLYEG